MVRSILSAVRVSEGCALFEGIELQNIPYLPTSVLYSHTTYSYPLLDMFAGPAITMKLNQIGNGHVCCLRLSSQCSLVYLPHIDGCDDGGSQIRKQAVGRSTPESRR